VCRAVEITDCRGDQRKQKRRDDGKGWIGRERKATEERELGKEGEEIGGRDREGKRGDGRDGIEKGRRGEGKDKIRRDRKDVQERKDDIQRFNEKGKERRGG
jgi:hypothetical protein